MFTQRKVLMFFIILTGVCMLGVAFYTASNRSGVAVNDVPDDFAFRYEWGACHAEWGRSDVKAERNGNVELELSEEVFKERKKYLFAAKEIAELYSAFKRNNFFTLNKEYRDTGIVDGACSALTLNANGKNHKVSMINKSPRQIENITTTIIRFLDANDTMWKDIDKRGMCNKATRACTAAKDYNGPPCDVWNAVCKEL